MKMDPLGWKFLLDSKMSSHGLEWVWKEGETRTRYGSLVMCEAGYHDSPSVFDALTYAKGCMLARTRSEGRSLESWHKYAAKRVSQELTVLAIRDVSHELRLWSYDCAWRILNRAEEFGIDVSPQSREAVEVGRLHSKGKRPSQDKLLELRRSAWDRSFQARMAAVVIADSKLPPINRYPDHAVYQVACMSAWVAESLLMQSGMEESAKRISRAALDASLAMHIVTSGQPMPYDDTDFRWHHYASEMNRTEIDWQRQSLGEAIAPRFKGVEG